MVCDFFRHISFSCFFFSSRRRHTRWNCDWSSDVSSSDLVVRSRLTAPFGPMRPAHAAAGCVVAMSAAATAAKPARNRRIPASSPALGRDAPMTPAGARRFPTLSGRAKPGNAGGGDLPKLGAYKIPAGTSLPGRLEVAEAHGKLKVPTCARTISTGDAHVIGGPNIAVNPDICESVQETRGHASSHCDPAKLIDQSTQSLDLREHMFR